MSVLITVVAVAVMFGLMISLHELGHFLVAKACGITVQEFSIGMGPQLCSFYRGGTKYALRLLPIGGYVAMEGENGESADPHAFVNQAPWKRVLVLIAGGTMNLILGFVVLLIFTAMQPALGTTVIAEFADGALSQQTGLSVDDQILKVNDTRILTLDDLSYALTFAENGNARIEVKRNGERVVLPSVQFAMQDNRLELDFKVYGEKKTLLSVPRHAVLTTGYMAKLVWRSLGDLLTGRVGFNELSGPVGVGAVLHEYAVDFDSILWIFALLTINVGIFNLLPVPALDGGRLVFVLIEWIFRKPVKRTVEAAVHAVGMSLLMLLMIAVTAKDILHLF